MFRWFKQLEKQPRRFFVAAAIATVVAIGVIDYAINHEITFSVFYLLAVGMATWFVGKRFGAFISLFSVAVSFAGDLAAGARYSTLLIPAWNASILLAFYLIVVWLLTNLRSLQKGLEARVVARTAELTGEIAERERLERELLEISEREQRRIGQDLHDSLCQHLTATSLAGQVLEEKLILRGLPEAAYANKVVDLVEEGISLARRLAKGLHPIELEAAGLMESLDGLASTTSELFKVSCRFECESPVLIHDPTTSGHLYRITQEALSNAIKHGKARNIIVRLETLDDGIALLIKDDGVGLPELPSKNGGMGLRIMAHRAGMIGAAFHVKREDSGGTAVLCKLGLPDVSGNKLP
ncbi:MAG TPA: sensor histidine kinase [Nitrospiria bacterium]|nr:sensor histidine kinase [Nitrospiria bacterium]